MLRGASDAGYAAVRNPQEGTILTVARALAERAEAIAGAGPRSRMRWPTCSRPARRPSQRRRSSSTSSSRRASSTRAAPACSRSSAAIASHVRGEELPEPAPLLEAIPLEAVHQELSEFRYCTLVLRRGRARSIPDELEAELPEARRLPARRRRRRARSRCTCTRTSPGAALALATAVGVIEEVDVKNMHVQTAEREERLLASEEPAVCGVVAVCAGAGNAEAVREPRRGLSSRAGSR